jgi:hypothetical protein
LPEASTQAALDTLAGGNQGVPLHHDSKGANGKRDSIDDDGDIFAVDDDDEGTAKVEVGAGERDVVGGAARWACSCAPRCASAHKHGTASHALHDGGARGACLLTCEVACVAAADPHRNMSPASQRAVNSCAASAAGFGHGCMSMPSCELWCFV